MDLNEEYQTGYYDGWHACKDRIIKILERFPLQTAALTRDLQQLHPSQPLRELGEDE